MENRAWIILYDGNNPKVVCPFCKYTVNYFWNDWQNANYCPKCGTDIRKDGVV